MEKLKTKLAALPTHMVGSKPYLSYQAVTDTVAAFLFPNSCTDQMDAAAYQHILETADTLCRPLGYQEVVKMTPPSLKPPTNSCIIPHSCQTAVHPPFHHAKTNRQRPSMFGRRPV